MVQEERVQYLRIGVHEDLENETLPNLDLQGFTRVIPSLRSDLLNPETSSPQYTSMIILRSL